MQANYLSKFDFLWNLSFFVQAETLVHICSVNNHCSKYILNSGFSVFWFELYTELFFFKAFDFHHA